jgi:hypothetical protein
MSELAQQVKYPDHFHYTLEFVDVDPLAGRHFYERYLDLAGDWADLSWYTPDDLDEIDKLIKQLQLAYLVTEHTKSVPDDDDAA